MTYRPIGARVIVEDIVTTLSLEARAAKVGLSIITDERNRPQPTQGKVIALGTDPMLREIGLTEGCVVSFDKLAGRRVWIEDVEYRSLELQEIIGVEDKINSPQPEIRVQQPSPDSQPELRTLQD
jgi:co-chaperonin GroES (HSP10)